MCEGCSNVINLVLNFSELHIIYYKCQDREYNNIFYFMPELFIACTFDGDTCNRLFSASNHMMVYQVRFSLKDDDIFDTKVESDM